MPTDQEHIDAVIAAARQLALARSTLNMVRLTYPGQMTHSQILGHVDQAMHHLNVLEEIWKQPGLF